MMLTEKNLNIFREKILKEDIHLPNGTKKAKVVTHVDLDGVISGITLLKQLEKQGIPKERVTVELAQYGDDGKEGVSNFTNKFVGKKNEFVGVSDFAKLPKAIPFSIFNKLTGFEGDKYKKAFADFMNSTDFTKMSKPAFKKLITEKFPIKENKFTENSIKELYLALKGYSNNLNEKAKLENRNDKDLNSTQKKIKNMERVNVGNIEDYEYQTVVPHFTADHHSNENKSLSGGQTGEIDAESPSEAEDLAKNYVPGMWSKKDIEAVSMVDSAGYNLEQLENTVFLKKHFTGADKEKNLATILSCLYDNLAKKDRQAAIWVIKNSEPNLASVYSKTLKAIGYNNDRINYLSKLKNGDVEGAKEILSRIPEPLSKQYNRKGEPDKMAMGHEDWIKKNKKDIENAKTGYKTEKDEKALENIKGKRGAEFKELREKIKQKKGKLSMNRNFTLFNGKDMKTQYSRYLPNLYSENNYRSPFAIRYWNGMFQAQKNPLYKGNVDFQVIQNHVFEDLKNFLLKEGVSSFKVESILKNMKKNNGGHSKGIWSFGGFDQIKPTSKELGNYYDKKDLVDRAQKIGKNPESLVPNAAKAVSDKQSVLDHYKDLKDRAFKVAISSVMLWTNELYPVDQTKMDALKADKDTFERNKD